MTIAGAVEEQTATTNAMAAAMVSVADGGRSIAETLAGVEAASRSTSLEIGAVRDAAAELGETSRRLQLAVHAFSR